MKRCYVTWVLLGLANFTLLSQNNYLIRLNDSVYEVSIEKEQQILFNGEKLSIELRQKDTLLYDTEYYSLQYPKGFQISEVTIEEGVKQIVLMTAEGSGYIVQSYADVNPSLISEMMLNELTKESIHYGYKMERKDYTRVLKSGQELNVLKGVLSYRNDQNVYEVAALGERDEGILVATVVMNNQMSGLSKGKEMIDLMWSSLAFKDYSYRDPELEGFDGQFYKNLSSTELPDDILIVVDGVPTKDGLNIDPDKIETITILKDESATEIYGERGKNGVIVIELKK